MNHISHGIVVLQYQIPNTEHMAYRLRYPEYGVGIREANLGQQGVIYPQGGRGVAKLPDVRRVLADRRPLQQAEARHARGSRVAPAR